MNIKFIPFRVRQIGRQILIELALKRYYDMLRDSLTFTPNLWFDDGYAEDYTIIYPLLKKYNMSGILAITTGNVGKEGHVTVPQLKTMIGDSWKIASHSVTHPNFKTITLAEAVQELRESKEWIRSNLEVDPICFVVPYGPDMITKEQRLEAEKLYPFVCKEKRHFHSWHFRSDVAVDPVVEFEQRTLRNILTNIELKSPFFKASLNEIKLPEVELADGYTLKAEYGRDVNSQYRRRWEQLYGAEWHVPPDGYVFFIEFNNDLVATYFVVARNDIGTFHSALTDPKHRRKGFYRYMTKIGLKHLINQGITEFEVEPAPILRHFWCSIGFRKVYKISPHAISGAVRTGI